MKRHVSVLVLTLTVGCAPRTLGQHMDTTVQQTLRQLAEKDGGRQTSRDVELLLGSTDVDPAAVAAACVRETLQLEQNARRISSMNEVERTFVGRSRCTRRCGRSSYASVPRYQAYEEIITRYQTRCRAADLAVRNHLYVAETDRTIARLEGLARRCEWVDLTSELATLERRISSGQLSGELRETLETRVDALKSEHRDPLARANQFLESGPAARARERRRALSQRIFELDEQRRRLDQIRSDCDSAYPANPESCAPTVEATHASFETRIATLRSQRDAISAELRELAAQSGVNGCPPGQP